MKVLLNIGFKFCILIFLLGTSGKIKSQVNLTQGLVAYYPFNGNANDASGNGHNAQTMNGIQLTPDRFGNLNSAYIFDGVDDYIRVTDNGAFSTPTFSLVLWFRTQSPSLQNLVGKRDFTTSAGSGGSQYQFFINYPPFPGIGSNIVGNTASCSVASASSYTSTGNTLCINRWYFAVVTFDGSRHKIYINGLLVRDISSAFNGLLACNSELRFGNWWSLDLLPFSGIMDDIRWYNRALNQQEVTALYDNYSISALATEFTFSQDACNPMRISFINNTQNPLIGQWYFGDGNTSSALNPVHTYAAPGTYNVKLVVTNTSGCTDSIVKPVSVNIANENVILTSDTTICLGQSIQLNTIANSDFCWQNGQYLNNANISNPIATPTQTITYYFNTKTLGNNLVNNGSFTGGNSGFSSQYIYTTSNNTEGQYFVGSNPPAWNSLFSNCTDHTTGTGNMLLVNGSPQPDVKVWCQSLAVLPNTNYEFSAWVQSVFPDNPAKLQFSINGIQVGNIFTAGSVCSWQRYGASWSSGNSTTANICIENKNTVIWGNDFALDDISLAPVTMRRDSITITVVPAPVILASNDTTICAGSSVQLNATGATIYSWTPSGGLSDPNIADPLATPSATTQYIVSGYDIPGCVVKDTVNISVDPQPVFSINPVQTNICEGDVLTITASGADNYQWFSGSQGNLSTNSQLQVTISTPEIYYVAMTDLSCNITDTLSSTITLSPKPQVTITKSNDIDCSLTQAQLIATGGATYSWTPVQNINNPGISYPMVYPDKDTWYKVIVTDGQGCSTVDSILVKSDLSKGQGNFLVSNGFTPNNDGKNDCFGVRYWGISSDFEFSIYNRWGELIFQTRDSQKCWDGTYKGMKQPPGVYVYQVKTKSPCSPVPVYRKGTVALIR